MIYHNGRIDVVKDWTRIRSDEPISHEPVILFLKNKLSGIAHICILALAHGTVGASSIPTKWDKPWDTTDKHGPS